MNRSTALELLTHYREQLPDALVTLDPEEGLAAATAGTDVVLISAPTVEYDTPHHATATWTLYLVPGARDLAAAWDAADRLLERLHAALPLSDARPYTWRPTTSTTPLPAYEATTTTDHDIH